MIKTQLTREDAIKIIEVGKIFMEEGRFKNHQYNPDGVLKILKATVTNPDKVFCAFDAQYRGLILMGISQHYFSTYKWATDFAFFVLPEYRGGTLAVRLLREAERWAKENGADEITILHNTGIKMDTSERFFNGVGYKTCGHIFSKDLQCAA
jgi:GNAT superfamily N-acetyltransferase